jgi:hypothetical protein
MQPNEHPKFLEALAGVHDFYGKDLSEFAGQVWIEACRGFELQQVTKALSAHLMDPERGQFMPKPADLVRQLQGTHVDRSLVAWGKAYEAMGRVGAWQSVVFDDPAIHSTIEDLGGWAKCCRDDQIQHLQRRFCELHRVHSKREGATHPAKLIGLHEIENRTNGKPVGAPMLIGNADAARKVLESGVSVRVGITSAHDAVQLLGAA